MIVSGLEKNDVLYQNALPQKDSPSSFSLEKFWRKIYQALVESQNLESLLLLTKQ